MSTFGKGGNGAFRGVVQQDNGQVTLPAPATAGALHLLVREAEEWLQLLDGGLHCFAGHDLDEVAGHVLGDDAAGAIVDGASRCRYRQFAEPVFPSRDGVLLALHDLEAEEGGSQECEHDEDEGARSEAAARTLPLGCNDPTGPLHC
jgi:hypothetical protein